MTKPNAQPDRPASGDPLQPRPSEEELVAYLDGELDAPTQGRVEHWLARDESIRRQVASLERSWEALESLETAEADRQFTQDTLETAAVEAEHGSRGRWMRSVAALAALLVSVEIGSLTVALLRDNPNQRLLENLPIVANLDEYRKTDHVEFLRQLRAADVSLAPRPLGSRPGGRIVRPGGASGDPQRPKVQQRPTGPQRLDLLASTEAWAEESLAARRAWIEDLAPADKEKLRRRWEQYEELSTEERRRLGELDLAIRQDSNPRELLAVMRNYHGWLKTLMVQQAEALGKLPVEDRVARIGEIQRSADRRHHGRHEHIRSMLHRWEVPSEHQPMAEDIEAFSQWMDREIGGEVERLISDVRPEFQEVARTALSQRSDPERRRVTLCILCLNWQRNHPGELPVSESQLKSLLGHLSAPVEKSLGSLTSDQQWDVLLKWMRTIPMSHISGRPGVRPVVRPGGPAEDFPLFQLLRGEHPTGHGHGPSHGFGPRPPGSGSR